MGDLTRELLQEMAARPVAFAAELLQSLLLIGIVVWGGRKYGARRLTERRERIAAELAAAASAERESAKLRAEALAVAANAEPSSAEIVRTARENAARERAMSQSEIDAAARMILDKAHSTVEEEKHHIRRDTADRLVHLTSDIARRYVDEFLSEAERRALTRKAIEAALDRLTPATATPAARETVK
jgi:F0F1-type ATP synthase membrane subunit b/b'